MRLDYPVDDPGGMGLAQCSDRRQGVQNIAHGAQPDHKQTELGLSVQTPIFSQQRVRLGRRNPAGEPVDCG
jgi:hypothetical protein